MLGLDEQTLERRSLAQNEALFRQGEPSCGPGKRHVLPVTRGASSHRAPAPLEIMKVRSAKERVILYLHLNAGPDGRTVDVRSQLRLVRHHEPATVAILEHIRHESINAQRIAILP